MNKKVGILTLGIFLIVSLTFALGGCGPEAEDEFVTIGAGSPGGVYYPLGAGIDYVLERRDEDLSASSETTGASVENARYVADETHTMGMAMSNIAYDAIQGEGDFEDDGELPLRTLFSMYEAQQHLIVPEDSDIESVYDLEGKSVSVDTMGSGCQVTSYIILEYAEILDDVDTEYYSQPEARDALIDGDVDAVFYNFASEAGVIEEIEASRDIRFIPMDDDLMADIVDDYPYFFEGEIPEGHYGLEEDVPSLNVGNLMLVHEDMDEDFAYELLTHIFHEESLEELEGIHPMADHFEVSEDVEPALHPGAEKFLEEQ
ncbi:TAXI family TRAP transporter solute-binding subunit [Natranaerofaba carboxydovora]|uniref:TAXI family TRAP transporter solute-binding subunit n=1 Tax=Natranaerofaba carboxydovora TaxID=2742683 RepID=UPI001F12D4FE|nr:TAXI family TRAP transporter solute-binding subunit [Natranaerofaba carboxydovora]UMZ73609.1 NMT1-like family protein [Natranaerofaba carboxydovora]